MSRVEEALLRLDLMALQDRYVATLDDDRLEEWPGMFTETCRYEIIARENEEAGLPAPLVYCDNVRMLRDRVVSLRRANIYERPAYRHFLSGFACKRVEEGSFEMSCNYVVVNTSLRGESQIYQAGKYFDLVVDTPQGLRFASKRVVYDTSRVQTLLAFPI
ncbi:MAG TPA: anthranilate 1,2-dioxygenase small subunit AndAd [Alphaproteobacteria bacterium]|nr:anthranilate 1,2-dioxygenase small subunit AndAd [Alphaproteobacteria bacterium]